MKKSKLLNEIESLNGFIKDKPYISSGFFETMRGEEFQITYHELASKPCGLLQRIKFCISIIRKI